MKRSEMIEIMVLEGDSEFVLTLEQIADRMLEAMEDSGMMPPQVKPIDITKLGGTLVYYWEKE